MLVLGRSIVGVGIGLASMTVPMYIAEISPSRFRGAMVTTNVLFITGGQFIAYLVAAGFANVDQGWRYMLGLSGVPAVIQFVGMIFMPESPRFLIGADKLDAARQVLTRMGIANVESEVSEIRATLDQQAQQQASFRDLLDPKIRRALIIGMSLQAFQQLCGCARRARPRMTSSDPRRGSINTAMYYSSTILKMAGFPDNQTAIFFSVFVALTNMAFTIVGMYLIDRAGRRPLLIYTLPGCIAGLALLGGAFYMLLGVSTKQDDCALYDGCAPCQLDKLCGFCSDTLTCLAGDAVGPANGTCSAWIHDGACNDSVIGGWMALLSLVVYVAFFAVGMGPVPWAVQSEIFPINVRGKANGLATASNWTANLIVSSTLLTLFNSISQAGTFWLYAGFAVAAWIFVIKMVPETKGRTLEEISAELSGEKSH